MQSLTTYYLGNLDLHALPCGDPGPQGLHIHLLGLCLQHGLMNDDSLHDLLNINNNILGFNYFFFYRRQKRHSIVNSKIFLGENYAIYFKMVDIGLGR